MEERRAALIFVLAITDVAWIRRPCSLGWQLPCGITPRHWLTEKGESPDMEMRIEDGVTLPDERIWGSFHRKCDGLTIEQVSTAESGQ
jgi:hypothetical protein